MHLHFGSITNDLNILQVKSVACSIQGEHLYILAPATQDEGEQYGTKYVYWSMDIGSYLAATEGECWSFTVFARYEQIFVSS